MSAKPVLDFFKNTQVIKKRGNVKMKSGIMKLMKNRYLILCHNSELGPACLVIYESLKHAEKTEIKSRYELSSLESVARSLEDSCGVTIILNDKTMLDFTCKSEEEACQWVKDISFLKQSSSRDVGYSSNFSTDEYSFEDVNFMVEMSPCNITKGQTLKCELKLSKQGLLIKDLKSKLFLAHWPLTVIKSYRLEDKNTAAVDVGSKATTGSGMFRFSSNQANEIVKSIHEIIRSSDLDRKRKISQERHIYQYSYDEFDSNYKPLTKQTNQCDNPYETLSNSSPIDGQYLTPLHFNSETREISE